MGTRKRYTYGALDRVLQRLGYAVKRTSEFTVWEHKEHNSIIVVPPFEPSDPLSQVHFVTTRRHLSDKGVIEPEDFECRLEEETAAAASSEAPTPSVG